MWHGVTDWLRRTVTDYAPDVQGRVFIACEQCRRIVPHFYVSGRPTRQGCKCGGQTFRPVQISEWRAAAWVIGCFLWRKVIRRHEQWDPRMPWRVVTRTHA